MRTFPRLAPSLAAAALLAFPLLSVTGGRSSPSGTSEGVALRLPIASAALGAQVAEAARPHRERVDALLREGRYDSAVRAARQGVTSAGVEMQTTLGRALLRTGDRAGAMAAFRAAEEGEARDALVARYHRGVLLFERGRVEESMRLFDSFIDAYGRGGLGSEELMVVGLAVKRLGRTDPVLFQDALRALDEAVAADPDNVQARIEVGRLFLDKYNSTDAREALTEVLAIDPENPEALVGMARAMDFDGEPGAVEKAREALILNPNLVEAHLFVGERLLGVERWGEAAEKAETALEIDPGSLGGWALLAAARYLDDDLPGYRDARDRALEINPRYPGVQITTANAAVQVRRYGEAAELAGEAVELDPRSWEGWGLLGINLLRDGEIENGTAALERAFAGDPYNVWFKNTLDLLDTFEELIEVETEHFVLVFHPDEVELLAPYAERLAEEAFAALERRYGFTPRTPLRVEFFRRHADFSVRTVGLSGMGALGVSFGPVLAMDSPAARDPGEFNWGSTLWHEIAHSFHLGMTGHRVPRWFSEGLAVHEQRAARPGWGHSVTSSFLRALHQDLLVPVSRMNDGFMRPRYPEQVIHSYLQSSLVFEWIESRWGYGSIVEILAGFGEGAETPVLLERVLGLDPDAVDEAFARYLRDRFEPALTSFEAGPIDPRAGITELEVRARAQPRDLFARLALGRAYLDADRFDEAEAELLAARDLLPDYAGPGNAHATLALLYQERGEDQKAADALHGWAAVDESALIAADQEARLRRGFGDVQGAAAALERTVWMDPYARELHERRAEAHEAAGNGEPAVSARRSLLALDPPDRARALYLLARSLYEAGDRGEARSVLLEALERAPNDEEALELLLELREGRDD